MRFEVSVVTETDADSIEGDADACAAFLVQSLDMTTEEAMHLLFNASFSDVDVVWPITLHITVKGRDTAERLQTQFTSLRHLGPGDWKFRYIDSGDTDEDI